MQWFRADYRGRQDTAKWWGFELGELGATGSGVTPHSTHQLRVTFEGGGGAPGDACKFKFIEVVTC